MEIYTERRRQKHQRKRRKGNSETASETETQRKAEMKKRDKYRETETEMERTRDREKQIQKDEMRETEGYRKQGGLKEMGWLKVERHLQSKSFLFSAKTEYIKFCYTSQR